MSLENAVMEVESHEGVSDESAGVQAVETGARILSAMIELGPTPTLKAIAGRAGMPSPKAHRYLVSFRRSGLVERDLLTGGYRLGPLAVRLGLVAIRHLNVVDVATPVLAELRDETGYTAGLAVWGNYGPTFVRFEETNAVVIISVRAGSVMPILSSATGRIFGAYMPSSLTKPLIKDELAGRTLTAAALAATGDGVGKMTAQGINALFETVRAAGLARVTGQLNRGIHALSAPVFDHSGGLVGAITLLGGAGQFDASIEGEPARILSTRARAVSMRLGHA